jgi:hypothetical protein
MANEVLHSIWPILAILAFIMVTCILGMLAAIRRNATQVHNRVRDCMKLRLQFQRPPGESGVDIIGEDYEHSDQQKQTQSASANTPNSLQLTPKSSPSKDPSVALAGAEMLGNLVGAQKAKQASEPNTPNM